VSAVLTGPAFAPCDRFYLLSIALEDVGAEHAAELLPLVTSAAMVVVRHMRGQVTDAEAYAHIDRARLAIFSARRPATTNTNERTT
jgi:hypothetical protein